MQKSERTALYDGFFTDDDGLQTIAPPIEIFHPVFGRFLQKLVDDKFEPSSEMVAEVSLFMQTAAKIIINENKVNEDRRTQLTKMFKRPFDQIQRQGGESADGVVLAQVGAPETRVNLVVFEYKRTIGEGGCDPLTQAEHSARKILFLRKEVRVRATGVVAKSDR